MKTLNIKLHNDRKTLNKLKEDLYLQINRGIDYITFKVHNNQNTINIHLDGTVKIDVINEEANQIINKYK